MVNVQGQARDISPTKIYNDVSEWHEREDKALYGILELTLLSISGHWNGKVGG
jgi:hypothetical protein